MSRRGRWVNQRQAVGRTGSERVRFSCVDGVSAESNPPAAFPTTPTAARSSLPKVSAPADPARMMRTVCKSAMTRSIGTGKRPGRSPLR